MQSKCACLLSMFSVAVLYPHSQALLSLPQSFCLLVPQASIKFNKQDVFFHTSQPTFVVVAMLGLKNYWEINFTHYQHGGLPWDFPPHIWGTGEKAT